MREIKFRAWDKELKKWNYFTLDNITTYLQTLHLHLLNGDEFYLYTGLHDKNDKEIWEGDLFWYDWHGSPILRVVEFHYGSFIGRDTNHIIPMDSIGHFLTNKLEVIGNIWETPELLETK